MRLLYSFPDAIHGLEQVLLVGMGGFLGANARYWLGGYILNKTGSTLPYHTFAINVSGSFLLGIFMALSLALPWDPRWRLFLAIGVLGGYTTFSTFEYETMKLLEAGQFSWALANMLGSVLFGLTAAWAGLVAGKLLTRGLA